jgi:hypothetical protein
MEKKRNNWSTTSEINHIKKLGSFHEGASDRMHLLRMYLVGARQRDNWGPIEKARVIKFVKNELNQLQGTG